MTTATAIENPRQCWGTPQDLFDVLNREFIFDLDAAANAENAKCLLWIGPGSTISDDLLVEQDWDYIDGHICNAAWLNPPFNNIGPFLEIAHRESRFKPWVCLLPNDTSTQWYREYVTKADEVRHLIGPRLQFESPEGVKASSNTMSNIIAIFRPRPAGKPQLKWDWYWRENDAL